MLTIVANYKYLILVFALFLGLRSLSRVSCDWCQEERIAGLVWRCVRCLDYHLCSQCYMADSHSTRHQFLRLHHKDPNKR